jgi:hypothetical protein
MACVHTVGVVDNSDWHTYTRSMCSQTSGNSYVNAEPLHHMAHALAAILPVTANSSDNIMQGQPQQPATARTYTQAGVHLPRCGARHHASSPVPAVVPLPGAHEDMHLQLPCMGASVNHQSVDHIPLNASATAWGSICTAAAAQAVLRMTGTRWVVAVHACAFPRICSTCLSCPTCSRSLPTASSVAALPFRNSSGKTPQQPGALLLPHVPFDAVLAVAGAAGARLSAAPCSSSLLQNTHTSSPRWGRAALQQ